MLCSIFILLIFYIYIIFYVYIFICMCFFNVFNCFAENLKQKSKSLHPPYTMISVDATKSRGKTSSSDDKTIFNTNKTNSVLYPQTINITM